MARAIIISSQKPDHGVADIAVTSERGAFAGRLDKLYPYLVVIDTERGKLGIRPLYRVEPVTRTAIHTQSSPVSATDQ